MSCVLCQTPLRFIQCQLKSHVTNDASTYFFRSNQLANITIVFGAINLLTPIPEIRLIHTQFTLILKKYELEINYSDINHQMQRPRLSVSTTTNLW